MLPVMRTLSPVFMLPLSIGAVAADACGAQPCAFSCGVSIIATARPGEGSFAQAIDYLDGVEASE